MQKNKKLRKKRTIKKIPNKSDKTAYFFTEFAGGLASKR